MMTFRVRFHRYGNGQSRISAPYWVQAEDFHDAAKTAAYMLSALREADRSHSFVIADISTHGLRGDEASSGWETSEEFSARVQVERGQA